MTETVDDPLSPPTAETTAPDTETIAATTQPPHRRAFASGNRWRRGHSGNPTGRPRGARDRATLAVEMLLWGEARRLTRKAVDLALAGDTTALKLCLERLAPPLRMRAMTLDLPPLNTAANISQGLGVVLNAAAQGEIDAAQAELMARVFETQRKSLETTELEERLARLEQRATTPGTTPRTTDWSAP